MLFVYEVLSVIQDRKIQYLALKKLIQADRVRTVLADHLHLFLLPDEDLFSLSDSLQDVNEGNFKLPYTRLYSMYLLTGTKGLEYEILCYLSKVSRTVFIGILLRDYSNHNVVVELSKRLRDSSISLITVYELLGEARKMTELLSNLVTVTSPFLKDVGLLVLRYFDVTSKGIGSLTLARKILRVVLPTANLDLIEKVYRIMTGDRTLNYCEEKLITTMVKESGKNELVIAYFLYLKRFYNTKDYVVKLVYHMKEQLTYNQCGIYYRGTLLTSNCKGIFLSLVNDQV